MKGQIALEYMGILMISITLFIATFYIASQSLGERREKLSAIQAQIIANDIATAVNRLCNKPEDSTIIVYEKIPDLVSLTDSTIGQKRILFTVESHNVNQSVYTNVDCAINGTLPTHTGSFQFKVMKTFTNVNVTFLTGG